MCTMVTFSWVGLLNQDPVGLAEPNAGPCMICPAQAKREIRRTRRKYLLERTFEDFFAEVAFALRAVNGAVFGRFDQLENELSLALRALENLGQHRFDCSGIHFLTLAFGGV